MSTYYTTADVGNKNNTTVLKTKSFYTNLLALTRVIKKKKDKREFISL